MGSTNQFVGTPTVPERLADPNLLWKSICKRVAYTLRVGLPGKIVAFDSVTQYCVIELQITENVIINEVISAMPIPNLHDVLLMLPGDSNWCITFPSLIGAECLVLFADMCISAWSTNGGVQNQEVTRRHSLSDGFAVLCPRSQPNIITNYSTTALEIRSLDNTVKIGLTESGITVTTPLMTVLSKLVANSLATTQIPTASTTSSDHSVPIVFNGVTYYMRLSTTP